MNRNINPLFSLLQRAFVIIVSLLPPLCGSQARALDGDKNISQCRMDVWTTKDGLPPRDVEAMAQTPDGYIWLATRAGLVRFDGVNFRAFDASNTPGFTRAMIRSLAVDAMGRLWVGTDGDGVGTFQEGIYTRRRVGSGVPRWSETRAILAAKDGSLWFVGQGEYSLVHKQGERVDTVSTQNLDIRGMTQDKNGTIWIASRFGGLQRVLPNGTIRDCNQGLPSTALTALCSDRSGGLWVGTEQNGVCRIQNGKVSAYTTREALSSNEIRSLCVDARGNVWIGTSHGLNRWRNGKIEVFCKRDGLCDDSVSAFLEDREHNLWAGTGAALSRLNNTKLTPFALPSLPGAHMHAMCQTPDGAIWIGTSEGLARIGHARTTLYTTREGLTSNDISDVYADKSGTLWALAKGGALLYFHQGRFVQRTATENMAQIGQDKRGLVLKDWNNLYRLRGRSLVRLARKQPVEYIFGFCTDSAGELWAGCDTGLGHVVNDHWEILHHGLLPDTHVLALVSPRAGELWLGTDKGLAHFQAGHFTLFTRRQGLPDDNIYQLLIDDAGTLWAGGNCGIFSLKIQDVQTFARGGLPMIPCRLYEAADGIRQFPIIFGAMKTQDGKLWFKGELGLTTVEPKRLQINAQIPPVVIEQAVFNGSILPHPQDGSIAPGKGDVEIRYSGLSLVAPEKVRFRYCLEGFDKGWIEAGARRTAYYTNLPPGTYSFRVMACNNDGVWNSRTPPLVFTLQPHFAQTWWFRALTAFASLLMLLILVRGRLRKLRDANHDLERRIAARTRELVQSNQELKFSKEAVEAANAQLHSLATTDGMTLLANHRAFQDRLRTAIADAEITRQPLTVLLADVDHFKQYNDTFGHPAGDEVLRMLGRVLRDNVRPGDCVARYGGEEFAVLLPNADTLIAQKIAERIRAAVASHPFPCRRVTLSIGMARSDSESMCPEHFVRLADQALYAAKHKGRNRVELAGQEMCPPCEERQDEAELSLTEAAAPTVSYTSGQSAALNLSGANQTLTGLLALLNLRDPETDGHSQRVARYALRLAQEVIRQDAAPLSPDELRDLTLGALLHDIGKIGVPDAILHKPGALTESEWEIMRRHPLQGAEILGSFSNLVNALPVVRSHHERWDGTGYPDRLAGTEIPLAARLFALADTLDAMSSDRPYRAALSPEAIREEITRMAGVQFDPALVNVFLTIPEAEWERLKVSDTGEMEWASDDLEALPVAA